MSSSTDTPRVRIVRHGAPATTPLLQDLDALSDAARRVVDPDALADALDRGYEDGRARGYVDGLAAGRAAAAAESEQLRAERAAEVRRAVDALRAACAATSRRQDERIADLEAAMVAGAFELAEALVGRELHVATAPGRDAVARALRLADHTEAVVARLHPDDVATLGDAASLAPGRELTIVTDPTVDRGGCLLQVGDGCVDARLGAALERVRQVLAP